MPSFKSIFITCSFMFLLMVGCNSSTKKNVSTTKDSKQNELRENLGYAGNYVSDAYEKRNEGYDWVAVTIKEIINNQLYVTFRSRADKKRPTCTFDGTFYKINDHIYHTFVEGKEVLLDIQKDTLEVKTKHSGDEGVLAFYCSGGANLAGKYHKINSALDTSQIDKTIFSQVLQLQGIGFSISSVKKGYTPVVTITPFGLEISNTPQTIEYDGQIVNAEIDDLNSDGSPEVLIYIRSDGSGSYGNVLGFSVNNKKSMSRIYFPPVAENNTINEGYMGHDAFSIVETKLVQRFPIYKEGDVNANPTGGVRQITYELLDGEASRYFKIQSISEED